MSEQEKTTQTNTAAQGNDAKSETLRSLFEAIKELIAKMIDKVLKLEEDGSITETAANAARKGLNRCLEGVNKVQKMSEKLEPHEKGVLYSAMFELKENLESFDKYLDSIKEKDISAKDSEEGLEKFESDMNSLSDKLDELRDNPITKESLNGFNLLETDTIQSMSVYEDKNGQYIRFKDRPDYFKVTTHESGKNSLDYCELNDSQRKKLAENVITDEAKLDKIRKDVVSTAKVMQKPESAEDKVKMPCLLIANMEMDIDHKKVDGVDRIKISEGKFVDKATRSNYTAFDSTAPDLKGQLVESLNSAKLGKAAKLVEKQAKYNKSEIRNYGSELVRTVKKADTVYNKNGFNCIFNSSDSTFRIAKDNSNEILVLKETNDAILKAELYRGVDDIKGNILNADSIDVAEWREEKTKNDRSQVFFNMKADILDSGYSDLASLMQSEYANVIINHRTGLKISDAMSNYKNAREQNLKYNVVSEQYTRDNGGDFTKLPSIDRIGFAQKRLFEQDGNVGGRYNGFSAGKINRGKNFEIVSPSNGTLYLNMHKNDVTSIVYRNAEGVTSEIINKEGAVVNPEMYKEKDFTMLGKLACDILVQAGMEKETQQIREALHSSMSSVSSNLAENISRISTDRDMAERD